MSAFGKNHPWLHDPAPQPSRLQQKAIFAAFGLWALIGGLIVRALVGLLTKAFRFSSAATGAIDSGRPIERRPPRRCPVQFCTLRSPCCLIGTTGRQLTGLRLLLMYAG